MTKLGPAWDKNGMYKDVVPEISPTVEIDGVPFIAEEITADRSFSYQEYVRKPILSGKEFVYRGKWVPKEYSFTTYVHCAKKDLTNYHMMLGELVNKPCKVLSPYMGATPFDAEIEISKEFEANNPCHMKLDITVKAID